jgi:hypothetical protein
MHIVISTIYLLQEQQLNHNKWYENKIIIRDFVQATEHGVHTHAKFGNLIFYGFLQLNTSNFAFLELHASQYCTKKNLVKSTAKISSQGF